MANDEKKWSPYGVQHWSLWNDLFAAVRQDTVNREFFNAIAEQGGPPVGEALGVSLPTADDALVAAKLRIAELEADRDRLDARRAQLETENAALRTELAQRMAIPARALRFSV